MEALSIGPIETILLITIGVLLLVQALYYLCLYNRIYQQRQAVKEGNIHLSQELPPLSVVISAREESENLRKNLTAVLEQDYPQFEVIVINDGNTDESDDYLKLMSKQYNNLYHSFVPEKSRYLSRKKLSITLGIKAAKYDWIVLTDANCRPQSNQWLRLMARNFTSHTQIVLGHSSYERGKGWLHKKVCFDNLFTSLRYLGFAIAGAPYMGLGRNMAYRKEVFYAQKGFSAHLNLERGDDDLFINTVANKENTRVETDPNACIQLDAIENVKEWRNEKIGYAYTARLLKGYQRWLLGLETTSRLFFYAGWIATCTLGILHSHWLVAGIAITAWLIRWGMQVAVINLTSKALNEPRRYYITLPVFDILQPLQSLRWKMSNLLDKKKKTRY